MGLFSDTEEEKNQQVRDALTDTMCKKLKDAVGGKCEKCTRKGNLEIHHIRPVAKGGNNAPSNLVALCPNCHQDADNGNIARKDLKKVVKDRTGKEKKEVATILRNRKKVEGRDIKERGFW